MRNSAPSASLRESVFLPRLIALTAVLLGGWRIASAWTVFSQTFDEPYHIACGLEWLDRGEYHYELQHPPLARLAAAAGLWLTGYHSTGNPETLAEGNAILHQHADYPGALRRARAGNLFFYATACLFLYLLARRSLGEPVAACSTVLFAHLPPVIAHARLATTDMACTAGLIVALYALDIWLARPDLRRGIALGAAFAFGILTKFSFLPFFAASAAVVLFFARKKTRSLRYLLASAAVFLILAAAVYRFHRIDTTENAPNVQAVLRHTPQPVQNFFTHMPLGQIVRGIGEVAFHMKSGDPSYLFGRERTTGWWYFFPVVLAFKTPLAFWILIVGAIIFAVSRDPSPRIMLSIAALILCVVLPSPLDLGVRHILPIYAPLSIAAGFAVWKLLTTPAHWTRLLALASLLWFFGAALRSWPNELSYFNELAGPVPERISVDSDFDWGQDLERLRLRLDAKGIHQFVLGYYGSADLSRAGLPSFTRLSAQPATGWIAVSVSLRRLWDAKDPAALAWLRNDRPQERIGTSYDLYWLPPK
jgi:hypothetical protein